MFRNMENGMVLAMSAWYRKRLMRMASLWGARLACLGLMASMIGDTSQRPVLVTRPHRIRVITKQHSPTSGLELLAPHCHLTHLLPHLFQPRLPQHRHRPLQFPPLKGVAVGMHGIAAILQSIVQVHLRSVK